MIEQDVQEGQTTEQSRKHSPQTRTTLTHKAKRQFDGCRMLSVILSACGFQAYSYALRCSKQTSWRLQWWRMEVSRPHRPETIRHPQNGASLGARALACWHSALACQHSRAQHSRAQHSRAQHSLQCIFPGVHPGRYVCLDLDSGCFYWNRKNALEWR